MCTSECVYLEAPLLQVCDRVAGHLILCSMRDGLPGDGCDRLCLLGQVSFVVREPKSETWQRTIAHLQD